MILVTGGNGYLGNRVLTLLQGHGSWLPRDRYAEAVGQTVIHCADVVPTTAAEADMISVTASVDILRQLLEHKPAFVVFPSTRMGSGMYRIGKETAEAYLRQSGIAYHILRFPGLWGPPKRRGLMWDMFTGEAVTLPPTWYTMHVDDAAQRCIDAARAAVTGRIDECKDARMDRWLDFIRGKW